VEVRGRRKEDGEREGEYEVSAPYCTALQGAVKSCEGTM
jgi:hypothetical protein